jgi:hypothetical protein
MKKAIAWQEGDKKWKSLQAISLEACNVNIDELTATVMVAQ